MLDFIDLEIQRHCPNPRPKALVAVRAFPLVMWQIVLLVEDDCHSRAGVIRSVCSLAAAARQRLTRGGMSTGTGDLARKASGPLLARYVALRVIGQNRDADGQRQHMRKRAEAVYADQLCKLAGSGPTSAEANDFLDAISQGELRKALISDQAAALISGRAQSSKEMPAAIGLGRVLFG